MSQSFVQIFALYIAFSTAANQLDTLVLLANFQRYNTYIESLSKAIKNAIFILNLQKTNLAAQAPTSGAVANEQLQVDLKTASANTAPVKIDIDYIQSLLPIPFPKDGFRYKLYFNFAFELCNCNIDNRKEVLQSLIAAITNAIPNDPTNNSDYLQYRESLNAAFKHKCSNPYYSKLLDNAISDAFNKSEIQLSQENYRKHMWC